MLSKSAASLTCCGLIASCAPVGHGPGGSHHSGGVHPAVPLLIGAAVVGGAIYAIDKHHDNNHYRGRNHYRNSRHHYSRH